MLHTLSIYDNFGESSLVKQPAYEYFGDLFASPRINEQSEKRGVS